MLKKHVCIMLVLFAFGVPLSGCKAENNDGNTVKKQIEEMENQKSDTASALEELLTIQEFGEKILDILKEEAPDYEFQRKDTQTLSVLEDGEEFLTLNLENAYNEYSVKEYDIDSLLDNYTNAVFSFLQDRDNELPLSGNNIMATIKPQDYIDYMREQGLEPVCDELVEGLYILYMHDMPNMAKPLTEKELKEAGIDRSDVHNLAVQNITETLIPYLEISEADGVYLTAGDGMYESGLILCDIWELYPAEHDYVIGIPDRSTLMIADGEDIKAIENMKALAENLYSEASYPVTGELLCWTGSDFTYLAK